MTTTKLMYEGATKKADLVRVLRERGYQNDIARPITKWKNSELVQALVDTENEGTPTAEPGDEESEDDDSDDDSDDEPRSQEPEPSNLNDIMPSQVSTTQPMVSCSAFLRHPSFENDTRVPVFSNISRAKFSHSSRLGKKVK